MLNVQNRWRLKVDEQESESTYLWTLPLGKCPVVQAARSSKGKQNHHTCCPSQLVCGDGAEQEGGGSKGGPRRCLFLQNPQL